MNVNQMGSASWATASFGESPEASESELSVLGEHLVICRALTGRLFAVQCIGEFMHGFVASRFVTTLVALAVLFTVSSQIL